MFKTHERNNNTLCHCVTFEWNHSESKSFPFCWGPPGTSSRKPWTSPHPTSRLHLDNTKIGLEQKEKIQMLVLSRKTSNLPQHTSALCVCMCELSVCVFCIGGFGVCTAPSVCAVSSVKLILPLDWSSLSTPCTPLTASHTHTLTHTHTHTYTHIYSHIYTHTYTLGR